MNSAISQGVCQKSMDTMSDSSKPVYPITPSAHAPPSTQHVQSAARGTSLATSAHTANAPDTAVSSATSHAPTDSTDWNGVKATSHTRSTLPRSSSRNIPASAMRQGAA